LQLVVDFAGNLNRILFVMVDWIMDYAPIGILTLTIVNFTKYGPDLAGPYFNIAIGVIIGIGLMIFVVYTGLIALLTRTNPFRFFKFAQEAMITAFVTRSSGATLPVSLKTAIDDLKIRKELAEFSLPLGATVNMDGVCIHLPMFAILAANLFGVELAFSSLLVLVITTVLAAVGAGGVPGGSLMLLFIILNSMGLDETQISQVVAFALGINPILDMFETMNNVTGDLSCTYIVACKEKMIESDQE
jgi:Na+/H+-dicarboxylate symporter